MDREQIQDKLAGLWKQHLPEIAERVRVLERACGTLAAGKLSGEERLAAAAAAHKLAGVLGTFGRVSGTELAREMEGMLESGIDDLARMKTLIDGLRRIVGDH